MSKLSEFIRAVQRALQKPTPPPPPPPGPTPAKPGAVGQFKRLTVGRLEVRDGPLWAALISSEGGLQIELLDSRTGTIAMVGSLNVHPDGSLRIRLSHQGQLFELPLGVLKALADASAMPTPNPEPAPETNPSNP